MIYTLVRVPYGRKDTPVELREYRVKEFPTTAVGTISEIRQFFKDQLGYIPEYTVIDTMKCDNCGEPKCACNPSYETLEHTRQRARTMDEGQMLTRLGRMKHKDKLEALWEVIHEPEFRRKYSTTLEDAIRDKFRNDFGEEIWPQISRPVGKQSWRVLRLGKTPQEVKAPTAEKAVELTGGIPEGYEMHVSGNNISIVPQGVEIEDEHASQRPSKIFKGVKTEPEYTDGETDSAHGKFIVEHMSKDGKLVDSFYFLDEENALIRKNSLNDMFTDMGGGDYARAYNKKTGMMF